jgi:hypothetical protein
LIGRLLNLVLGFLALVVLVTLGVANRHNVMLVLDPFKPEAPVISLQMPFFIYIFLLLGLGVVLGGVAVWMNQGRWRRLVRSRTQDAARWRGEAERLTRERDAGVAEKKKLLALANN